MTDRRVTREVAARVLDGYPKDFLDPGKRLYLDVNKRRYEALIEAIVALLGTLTPDANGRFRILDIGPRFELDLLHRLAPEARVDTLGLGDSLFPPRDDETHYEFNLTFADDASRRPALTGYQLIVMADVLERLAVAPSVQLGWLVSLLDPAGYLLIQTTNAVALPNRLRMLFGRQPQPPLSPDRRYPGHVREYTIGELVALAPELGLEVVRVESANWLDGGGRLNGLYNRAERLIPKSMRAGITVVYRRVSS